MKLPLNNSRHEKIHSSVPVSVPVLNNTSPIASAIIFSSVNNDATTHFPHHIPRYPIIHTIEDRAALMTSLIKLLSNISNCSTSSMPSAAIGYVSRSKNATNIPLIKNIRSYLPFFSKESPLYKAKIYSIIIT